MVKALHRRRHRGDPRRRLQPHRRGQPPRARCCRFKGVDNASLLPARARRPALLHGLHGHGQLAQRRAPERPAADHGLAALLGHRSATSTASASTSPARWPASSTTSTACSAFFDIIHQDPVLSQVKLIAEPWDVGPGGYQVGNFPVLWSEWNGIYRDVVRDFWRGAGAGRRVRLALHRLERPLRRRGPAPVRVDQLHHRPRRLHAARPRLLQREAQRGQPRGQPRRHRRQPLVELRRRGRRPTTPRSTRCARRQQRNFLATLLLSQGVPMLLGGDELGRTQGGNNNAWCQDNEISWFDWDLRRGRQASSCDFTRRLIALRRDHPVFRRAALPRRPRAGGLGPAGRLVVPPRRAADDPARLGHADAHTLGVFLNGEEIADRTRARRADRGRLVPAAVQRPPRGRDVHAPGAPLRQPSGRTSSARADPERRAGQRPLPARARACPSPRAR